MTDASRHSIHSTNHYRINAMFAFITVKLLFCGFEEGGLPRKVAHVRVILVNWRSFLSLAGAATSVIFVATNTCLSRQNTSVVATKICLSRQRLCGAKLTFVATNTFLLRQKDACRDKTFVSPPPQKFCRGKHTFFTTKDVCCRDKHGFVATKIILVAAPANYTF